MEDEQETSPRKCYSRYPISKMLYEIQKGNSLNVTEFVSDLGYRNINSALRKFGMWMIYGEGERDLIDRIVQKGWASKSEISKALSDTKSMQQAEFELRARKAFLPHMIALTYESVPRQIGLFAMTGGSTRRIWLPSELSSATDYEAELIGKKCGLEYLRRFEGNVPFFGRVSGFEVRITFDRTLYLDASGDPTTGVSSTSSKTFVTL